MRYSHHNDVRACFLLENVLTRGTFYEVKQDEPIVIALQNADVDKMYICTSW